MTAEPERTGCSCCRVGLHTDVPHSALVGQTCGKCGHPLIRESERTGIGEGKRCHGKALWYCDTHQRMLMACADAFRAALAEERQAKLDARDARALAEQRTALAEQSRDEVLREYHALQDRTRDEVNRMAEHNGKLIAKSQALAARVKELEDLVSTHPYRTTPAEAWGEWDLTQGQAPPLQRPHGDAPRER